MKPSLWDLMRSLPCDACGAAGGEPCLGPDGKPSIVLHPARYRAAKRHLREQT